MSKILEELPVILIWVSIWGIIDLAVQALIPESIYHKGIAYAFLLSIAIFLDFRTPGGYF
jgi:hypothetical protein